ncbi:hypothetical protein O1W71_16375 [Microbacterium sp. H37-C3]|uniref:hypothetical protein n=1 Tax=Microbacterium sp. H37-C3 TaxID=3004354 RepID=UPI0022AE754D|nr:hypothetical protein [Microbacterium sp. H37-C3]MCZ4069247.1 hypothetical protein [Microbacterium sp. H37-C3]
MELRIRSANDSTSRFLADIPFRPEVIDSVIPILAAWGVFTNDNSLAGEADMTGQFVDNGEKAYFEIVIGAEE